jgi:8-oxo-(d)GTP phosphatase
LRSTLGERAIADDLVLAAGAVLWRRGPDGPDIALIHRPKYDDWSFPKGKLKNGEHVLRGAVREVLEETGVMPRLGRRLPPQFYLVGNRPKRVDYWVATPAAGRSGLGRGSDQGMDGLGGFVPGDEVDRMEWVPVGEAERRLSYDRDVELLHEATAGPLRSTPVIILRHGAAGEKSDWHDLDILRPLDVRGRVEARELAELLAPFVGGEGEPVRLVSSATARCVETLLPFSLIERASVTTERAFTVDEAGPPPDLASARQRIFELAAAGVPAVVCTHGEIVPTLLDELCERLGRRPPDDPTLRKGAFWVLQLATSAVSAVTGIVGLEHHAPSPPNGSSAGPA